MQSHTSSEAGNHQQFSHLTDEHVKHLLGRGFTHTTIEAAVLWSASAEQADKLLGVNPHSGSIVIPYRHPLTGEVVLNRVRPDMPPIFNGKPAKYLSPKGAGNYLYFPPNCAKLLRDPSVPIGLVEGEFKTLWAYQVGLFYVGLTGVYGFLGKNDRGETRPIPDLDLITWQDRAVTITFDSDVATNEKVRAAREALARELYRRGARVVYKIDLPELDGHKTGLDDFLKAQGVEAFYDLDAEEITSPYPRVKVWTLVELRAASLKRPAQIVPGWGITEKGKVMVTGAGGRGKSVFLLQMNCHLSAGTPIVQHPQVTVAAPQRVLIYMAEDPLAEVRFRLLRQIEQLGYGSKVEERIHILDFGDRKPQVLTDPWALQVLADRIRQHRATVVTLDPLVSLHDRDENSNPQMRAVLDAVTPIAEETGCTFIFAHHEPKSPENNSAASRGASAIRDWCRTMLRLTSQKSGPDGTKRFQLDLDKANYGGTVWNLTLERKQDSYIFTPIDLEAAVTPRAVWEIIGREGTWLDDVQDRIIEQFSVSKATAYRAIKKTEEKQLAVIGEKINPETHRKKSYLTRGTGNGGEE